MKVYVDFDEWFGPAWLIAEHGIGYKERGAVEMSDELVARFRRTQEDYYAAAAEVEAVLAQIGPGGG